MYCGGDGSPSREFLYVEDAAKAIYLTLKNYNGPGPINIGTGKEITMKDLAELVKSTVGYQGSIKWDTNMPNGQPRRCLDVSRAKNELGFEATTDFKVGLESTYKWFIKNYESIMINEGIPSQRKAASI